MSPQPDLARKADNIVAQLQGLINQPGLEVSGVRYGRKFSI